MAPSIELTCDQKAYAGLHKVADVQRGKTGTIDKEALRRLLVDHHRLLEFARRSGASLKGEGWW